MDFEQISIYSKEYDDLCFKLTKELDVSLEELDYKFGIAFIKTLGEIYIFEVRDKGKYLMAKLTYDI
jgi:hypothetical protein